MAHHLRPVDIPRPKYLGKGDCFLIPASSSGASYLTVFTGRRAFCSCPAGAKGRECLHATSVAKLMTEAMTR